jgi:hypothetical protein
VRPRLEPPLLRAPPLLRDLLVPPLFDADPPDFAAVVRGLAAAPEARDFAAPADDLDLAAPLFARVVPLDAFDLPVPVEALDFAPPLRDADFAPDEDLRAPPVDLRPAELRLLFRAPPVDPAAPAVEPAERPVELTIRRTASVAALIIAAPILLALSAAASAAASAASWAVRALRRALSRTVLFAASAAAAVTRPAASRLRATGFCASSAARRPASRSASVTPSPADRPLGAAAPSLAVVLPPRALRDPPLPRALLAFPDDRPRELAFFAISDLLLFVCAAHFSYLARNRCMSARTVPTRAHSRRRFKRGDASLLFLFRDALSAILMRVLVALDVAAGFIRTTTEVAVAIAFAVRSHGLIGRLDNRRGIVATAFVALEMLRYFVVARFVAAGQRMALAGHECSPSSRSRGGRPRSAGRGAPSGSAPAPAIGSAS